MVLIMVPTVVNGNWFKYNIVNSYFCTSQLLSNPWQIKKHDWLFQYLSLLSYTDAFQYDILNVETLSIRWVFILLRTYEIHSYYQLKKSVKKTSNNKPTYTYIMNKRL